MRYPKEKRPPDKPPNEKAPGAVTPGASNNDNSLPGGNCHFNSEFSLDISLCQPLDDGSDSFGDIFKLTCSYCITPPTGKQHTAARCLVEQAKRRVDQASDDDVYGIHYAILMAGWPLAFADAMEVTL